MIRVANNNSRVLERSLLAPSEPAVLQLGPRAHQPQRAAADGLPGADVRQGCRLDLGNGVKGERADDLHAISIQRGGVVGSQP